jgi:formylglycine-generating enzyme required for sulfatase activity
MKKGKDVADLASRGFIVGGTTVGVASLAECFHIRTGLSFVLIPAGTFWRGSESATADEDEQPYRMVRLTRPFLIARTPCTQVAWSRGASAAGLERQVTGLAKAARFPTFGVRNDLPVYHVSWLDASRWCEVNGLELPTEAQWEYACRAGTKSDFWFGDVAVDDWSTLERYLWYAEHNQGEAPPVSSMPMNSWGLYDVHGTIWEWCRDRYDPRFYALGPTSDPLALDSGYKRVHRGGAWDVPARCCRASARYRDADDYCHGSIGFRPSLTL